MLYISIRRQCQQCYGYTKIIFVVKEPYLCIICAILHMIKSNPSVPSLNSVIDFGVTDDLCPLSQLFYPLFMSLVCSWYLDLFRSIAERKVPYSRQNYNAENISAVDDIILNYTTLLQCVGNNHQRVSWYSEEWGQIIDESVLSQ